MRFWLLTSLILLIIYYIESKLIFTDSQNENEIRILNIQINGYSPEKNDDYVSIAIKAEPGYVIKFEPSSSADRVHHIVLYGCSKPAFSKSFWKGSSTCLGRQYILYAWAINAPSLELPKDVAFSIGNEGDEVKYLIMQIHYAHPFLDENIKDFSGLKLYFSPIRPKYIAQIYLFVSQDSIPPGLNEVYNNISCYYRGNSTLHAFAFRTHTHSMGKVVSAYLMKPQEKNEWKLIGKRNPQWPQLFQKLEKKLEIKYGDFMAAMCRFDSHDKIKSVPMGPRGMDEMCNFYIMFYRSINEPDPFPDGAVCGENENPKLVANKYPKDGTTLLPFRPELEQAAGKIKVN